MKAAQIFFEGRTRFVTDWAQKTSLTKLVTKRSVLQQFLPTSHHNFFRLVSLKAAQKFFEGRTRFVTDWAQKTSLTKLVLKRSVLQQSLPNFHHNLF